MPAQQHIHSLEKQQSGKKIVRRTCVSEWLSTYARLYTQEEREIEREGGEPPPLIVNSKVMQILLVLSFDAECKLSVSDDDSAGDVVIVAIVVVSVVTLG